MVSADNTYLGGAVEGEQIRPSVLVDDGGHERSELSVSQGQNVRSATNNNDDKHTSGIVDKLGGRGANA